MLPLPSIRVPCFGRSWTIWKHKEARPRPPRRLFETGAHAQCRMKNEECRMQRDGFCGCYGLTPAEIELTSKTAPPRMLIPPPAT
jgi:hypothetical protein